MAKKGVRNRRFNLGAVRVTFVFVFLFSLVLTFSLFKIQVVEHKDTALAASEQYYSNQVDPARRGSIYDRNGVKLAASSFVYRIGVTPKHVYSRLDSSIRKEDITEKISGILDLEYKLVEDALKNQEASYVQLAKDVPEDVGKKLAEYLNQNWIGGVRLDKEPKRYYLNGDLASQVLGFASYNDGRIEGRLGMELAYDAILSGESGYTYAARDNYLSHGYLPYSQTQEKQRVDGADIVSTIDINIQKILQEDLEAAIKAYDAVEDGMGIVMNPYTGEIYAMASYPYFKSDDPTAAPSGINPDDWDPTSEEDIAWLQEHAWRNKNISSLYEAGSTMKALTAAIALEENTSSENTWYSDLPITILDAEISSYGEALGQQSLEQAFWNSSNTVFVQVALDIGIEKYYNYMHAFGFYETTGIGLPGEASCIFHTNPSLLDLANLSFGESSAVTPMHLARSFAALVNGGKLVTPTVIKEVRNIDGQILRSSSPNVTRRVISSETSARVRNLMEGMVKHASSYTNTWGYNMGGKTSTSTDEITNQVTVSFVAAAPIEHPEIIVLMILQKPSNNQVGGSEAQIVTQNTCSRILDYLNVDRLYTDEDAYKLGKSIHTPNMIGLTVAQAAQQMTYEQISVVAGDEKTFGDSKIAAQSPLPDTLIYPGTNIYVYSEIPEKKYTVIPDLSQMNYNEVISACNQVGLVAQFEGNLTGNCVSQRVLYDSALAEGASGNPGDSVLFGSVLSVVLELP